jgi:hypothetical protein
MPGDRVTMAAQDLHQIEQALSAGHGLPVIE